MATQKKASRVSLSHILGLILIVALIWFVLAVVKGVLGFILTALCIIAAGAIIWRLLRGNANRGPN